MALKFDMGNSKWRELAAMQQQQSMSNLGRDIGGAFTAGGDYLQKNKSKVGKAYQKYLTDPNNMDQRETIINAKGEEVTNPNKGKFMGQMRTFSEFQGEFQHKKRSDRLKKKFGLRPRGELNVSGDYENINPEYLKILEDTYGTTAGKRKYGKTYDPNVDKISAAQVGDFTEEERRGAYYDWMNTDEARGILKGHRKERRGEFFDKVGQFGQKVGEFGKKALPYATGAAATLGAIANPALGAVGGLGYGFTKLPSAEDIAKRKAELEELQTGGATKTGGLLGRIQRFLPGGKFGYTTAPTLSPTSIPGGTPQYLPGTRV